MIVFIFVVLLQTIDYVTVHVKQDKSTVYNLFINMYGSPFYNKAKMIARTPIEITPKET